MSRVLKDSGIQWIGKIPENWIIKKIKYIANSEENSFIDGDWIEAGDISSEGIRYLTTGNIGDGVYKEQGNGFISENTFERLNCKYAFPGDLIFSRLNSPYGRSCILPSVFDKCVLAVDNVILRTDENKKYICYLTQCEGYHKDAQDKSSGTTMKRLSRSNLGNIKLPFPPLSEQQKIADYLDKKCSKIDEQKANYEKSIELLREYKQSLITEAVTKGLDKNVEMKDSGIDWIGKIPNTYTVSRLREVSERIIVGLATTVTPYYRKTGIPMLRNLNIKDGFLDDSDLLYLDEDFAKGQTSKFIKEGDILTVHTGSNLGLSCIAPKEYKDSLSFTTLITTPNKLKITSSFLLYSLVSHLGKREVDKLKCGDIKPNLNVKQFQFFTIIYPPMDEQMKITSYLDKECGKIDKVIAYREQMIEKLDEYKKSLIYECVTGKKEIK